MRRSKGNGRGKQARKGDGDMRSRRIVIIAVASRSNDTFLINNAAQLIMISVHAAKVFFCSGSTHGCQT